MSTHHSQNHHKAQLNLVFIQKHLKLLLTIVINKVFKCYKKIILKAVLLQLGTLNTGQFITYLKL